MAKGNSLKFGLTGGLSMVAFHFCWLVLVAAGGAQAFMDWVLQLHMIKPFYVIMPFDWGNALMLLIVTFIVGFLGGAMMGGIWGGCCKDKK